VTEVCSPGYARARRVWNDKASTLAKYDIPMSRIWEFEVTSRVPARTVSPASGFTGAANERDPHRPSRVMTARFRQENTEGYSDADLAALNAAFEEVKNANADLWANDTSPGRDLAFRSWQDLNDPIAGV
jgi:hypothetical protein